MKDQIAEVWNKASKSSHEMLNTLLGVPAVKARIEELLALPTLPIVAVDRASNTLPVLGSDFTRSSKLLRGLVRAIGLAAVLLALLHFAGPWLALAVAVAYLSAIGGVLLIGGEYTGGRRLLHWVEGVGPIAEHISQGIHPRSYRTRDWVGEPGQGSEVQNL